MLSLTYAMEVGWSAICVRPLRALDRIKTNGLSFTPSSPYHVLNTCQSKGRMGGHQLKAHCMGAPGLTFMKDIFCATFVTQEARHHFWWTEFGQVTSAMLVQSCAAKAKCTRMTSGNLWDDPVLSGASHAGTPL
eukprot:4073613-Amphidinium_carterae.1